MLEYVQGFLPYSLYNGKPTGVEMQKMVPVPEDLLWDYVEAPQDLLWRLQRIADYFPRYGNDRETVQLLYYHRNELKLDEPTKLLIEEYYRAWKMHP